MAFVNTVMGAGWPAANGTVGGFPLTSGMALDRLGGMDFNPLLMASQQLAMYRTEQLLCAELTQLLGGLMQASPGAAGSTDASLGGSSPVTASSGDSSGSSSDPASSGSSGAAGASGSSSSSGSSAPASNDLLSNVRIVAQVAKQKGVDPATAVATMLVESNGSNNATGDGGTSFGLFQLHKGGELGSMSPDQARDPQKNAEVALSVFAQNKGKYSDPGQLAAASQRPADRAGYARKVDEMLPKAKQLLQQAGVQ